MGYKPLKLNVAQSCPTLCNPMDCSLPGFSVHGILQARTLEWVAVYFSRGFSKPRDWTQVSCLAGRLFTISATREARVYLYTWSTYVVIILNQVLFCVLWKLSVYTILWSTSLCPWDFPGKNIGVGYHLLLQGIFPTQGSLHWQVSSLPLSYQGSLYLLLLKIPVYTVMNITSIKQSCSGAQTRGGTWGLWVLPGPHSSLPPALCHMWDPNRSSVRGQSMAVFPWHPGKNAGSHLTLASAL